MVPPCMPVQRTHWRRRGKQRGESDLTHRALNCVQRPGGTAARNIITTGGNPGKVTVHVAQWTRYTWSSLLTESTVRRRPAASQSQRLLFPWKPNKGQSIDGFRPGGCLTVKQAIEAIGRP